MKVLFKTFFVAGFILAFTLNAPLSAQGVKTIKENFTDSTHSHKVEYRYTVLNKAPYDTKHGKYTWYFDNGNIKAVTHYKNGLKEGPFATYNRWGTKRAEGTFKSNQLEGTFKNYLPQGGLDYVGKYVNGYRHGSWRYFYPGGGLKKVVEYNMGREVDDRAQGN